MSSLSTLNLRSFAFRISEGETGDPGIDIEALAQPLSEDRPCGDFLLYEGTYDRIRQARSEDDTSLPQGMWESTVRVADWKLVRDVCLKALKAQTKDVQIALWLTESLARLYGFHGLACGLDLMHRFCSALWPSLYPELDDGDPEARVNAFVWLNESLSRSVARLPITQVPDVPSFSLADWDAAVQTSDPNASLPTDGGKRVPSTAHIEIALSETPADHLRAVYVGCQTSLRALDGLDQALKDVLTRDQLPSFGQMRRVLHAVSDRVGRQLDVRGGRPAEEQAGDRITPSEGDAMDKDEMRETPTDQTASSADSTSGFASQVVGPIRSRSDAFRVLREAADYLGQTEPHSPVPYLVRRAIRWGSMPLSDLLVELLENSGERDELIKLLGMEERSEE